MTNTVTGPIAIVDMGSNGIRFGIVSSLSRHLPVVYEERAPISLLDAQGEDRTIPLDTIHEVVKSFLRFKELCKDANVPLSNVRVLATEATRIATNATEFMDSIFQATGWTVTLLPKQEEALVSASGIVGSFYTVNGLTSDCGGGSVELSYVMSDGNGVSTAQTPVSLPYGAMALKKRLQQCEGKKERQDLYLEVESAIRQALKETEPPNQLKHKDGYEIYMSGGGFRALGYLSMARKSHKVRSKSNHKHSSRQPDYPIPMINGYTITGKSLKKLVHRYRDKKADQVIRQVQGFRISKRRAEMMPAVCLLVSAMLEAIPIRQVHFSEGGVRQGICYQMLSNQEQSKDPLLTAVKDYISKSDFALNEEEYQAIFDVLKSALPSPYLETTHPLQLHRLLPAAIHLANLTSHYPKESRAFVAFHIPLPSGPLANVPGLTHKERATLALLLAYRQGGAVPDPIFYRVQRLVGKKGISVCKYLGRLMELIYSVSPLHPGVGVLRSGLKFSTVVTDAIATGNSEDECTSNNDENESAIIQPSDSNNDDDDDDDDDDTEDDNIQDKTLYPSLKLRIQLPSTPSTYLDAPAIRSMIENLDKKVNTRKFDIDDEQRRLHCPTLFSVDISQGLV
ncbi:Ppx/GppA phosphatase family-domain-containing protein [Halteromyces radiatus]|uniref:Ppx/GppA phosphatase family-domain-containing protein n=1 Tax=Halteromyces radiatus TaxID=101107 RepID=UPI00221EC19D|nr:Ppx/GppA phosphatase family-domain-containing protein [Halteromyces radiatus]KAI8100077.1 Ppx/GppA phosphatase family-domain-containing protein [Halteromyces radiatus]